MAGIATAYDDSRKLVRPAKRRARAAAEKHAGAIAFTRTGDLISGDFGEAEVIAVYGAVDVGKLTT